MSARFESSVVLLSVCGVFGEVPLVALTRSVSGVSGATALLGAANLIARGQTLCDERRLHRRGAARAERPRVAAGAVRVLLTAVGECELTPRGHNSHAASAPLAAAARAAEKPGLERGDSAHLCSGC